MQVVCFGLLLQIVCAFGGLCCITQFTLLGGQTMYWYNFSFLLCYRFVPTLMYISDSHFWQLAESRHAEKERIQRCTEFRRQHSAQWGVRVVWSAYPLLGNPSIHRTCCMHAGLVVAKTKREVFAVPQYQAVRWVVGRVLLNKPVGGGGGGGVKTAPSQPTALPLPRIF